MKTSQAERLYNLLLDGSPHNTAEICAVVYGGEHLGLARVGARIYDIKKKYNVEIEGWHDKDNPSIYWYQIKKALPDLTDRLAIYFLEWSKKDPAKKLPIEEIVKAAENKGYQPNEVIRCINWLQAIHVIKCEAGQCNYVF